jgi:hypothetical protein
MLLAALNGILSKSSFGKTNLQILTVTVLYDILQKNTISGIIEAILNVAIKAQKIICIFFVII